MNEVIAKDTVFVPIDEGREIVEQRTTRAEELFTAAQRYDDLVMSDEHYDDGAVFRTLIKNEMGINETARTKLVKPLNDHVKFINGQFKPASDRMKAALAMVDGKMIPWAREQAKKLKLDRVPAVATAQGSTSIVKRWTYEIVDINRIPKRYWIIDEAAIGKDVRGGVRRINGVKIFQKEGLTQ